MPIHKADHVFGIVKPRAAGRLVPRPGTRGRAFRDQGRPRGMFDVRQLDPAQPGTGHDDGLVLVRTGDIVSAIEHIAGIIQKRLVVQTFLHVSPLRNGIVREDPIGIKPVRRAAK